MSDDTSWRPLDPAGLKARLAQVRALLIQAAAVGMTQDAEKLEQLAELERRIREPPNAPPRRYR